MKYGYLASDDILDIKELPSDDIVKQRGIYVIVNTVSHKVYVGKTAKSFKYRYDVHLYELYHNCHINKHLQNAFKKYGTDAFIFCIYEVAPYEISKKKKKRYDEFKKWISNKEIETIKHFRSILPQNAVYNQNDGGEGGVNPTPELSQKLHDKNVASWKRTSTRKKRIDGIKKTCKINSESGKLSKVQEECWKNPETRENRINGIYKAYQDPVKKKNHRDGVRAFYKTFDGKWQLAELKEKRWPDMFAKIYNDIETLGKLLIDNKKMYELVVR